MTNLLKIKRAKFISKILLLVSIFTYSCSSPQLNVQKAEKISPSKSANFSSPSSTSKDTAPAVIKSIQPAPVSEQKNPVEINNIPTPEISAKFSFIPSPPATLTPITGNPLNNSPSPSTDSGNSVSSNSSDEGITIIFASPTASASAGSAGSIVGGVGGD